MTILILLVFSLMGLTKLWSYIAFSHMTFDTKVDKTKVFPGERIRVEIAAKNNKILPVWLELDLANDGQNFVCSAPVVESSFLLWFQETTFSWDITAQKRGCFYIK